MNNHESDYMVTPRSQKLKSRDRPISLANLNAEPIYIPGDELESEKTDKFTTDQFKSASLPPSSATEETKTTTRRQKKSHSTSFTRPRALTTTPGNGFLVRNKANISKSNADISNPANSTTKRVSVNFVYTNSRRDNVDQIHTTNVVATTQLSSKEYKSMPSLHQSLSPTGSRSKSPSTSLKKVKQQKTPIKSPNRSPKLLRDSLTSELSKKLGTESLEQHAISDDGRSEFEISSNDNSRNPSKNSSSNNVVFENIEDIEFEELQSVMETVKRGVVKKNSNDFLDLSQISSYSREGFDSVALDYRICMICEGGSTEKAPLKTPCACKGKISF
eukprot:Pgem_evm1s13038